MTMGRLPSGSVSLREAAVRIFALVALLPFLLLVFLLVLLLQRPDLVTPLQLEVSLLLAFVTTCVGFVAFYRMVAQIATIAGVTGAASPGDGAPSTAAVQAPTVPGLGQIAEIGQMGATLSRMLEDLRTSTGRLEDQVLKSSTLNELVELAAKVPRIQDLLALVLEKTMRAVSATIGSIMLLDRERQILRVAAARGLPEDALAGAEVGVGEGIAGTVAALGEPVLVEDIETDPRFARVNDPRYGSGSFICLPIRVEDRVIGVINLTKGLQGMGLGLSVIHGTVRRHRGELSIESGEGKGTVVTIRLPRRSAAAQVPAPSDAQRSPVPRRRVLLIDDQPEVRAGLADLLTADGHAVIEAGDGPEALARLDAGEWVDLVLTDLGMPGMTGWDVARAIKARWPGLPVGLVTGWTNEVEAASADHALVDFVLAKPLDREALRQALAPSPRGHVPALP